MKTKEQIEKVLDGYNKKLKDTDAVLASEREWLKAVGVYGVNEKTMDGFVITMANTLLDKYALEKAIMLVRWTLDLQEKDATM